MQNNIEHFITNFKKIRRQKFSKALRNGYTGIGFTYESLLGKKEDNSYNPDFEGIEIKTKLGYSKSNITLFTLTPQSEEGIKYIYNKYAYSRRYNQSDKNFRCDIYAKSRNLILNRYIIKIKVDRINQKIKLIFLNSLYQKIDDKIFWNFSDVKERLNTKLSTLAIVKGYPYKINNERVYKYTNLSIYKLKGFEDFLRLIEEDKIYITFNIGTHLDKRRYGQIYDRGTAFKIKNSSIEELFDKIYWGSTR